MAHVLLVVDKWKGRGSMPGVWGRALHLHRYGNDDFACTIADKSWFSV